MKNKKNYETPEINVVYLEEDVLDASVNGGTVKDKDDIDWEN